MAAPFPYFRNIAALSKGVWRRRRGASLLSTALVIGLVAVVAVGAVGVIGDEISDLFGGVGDELAEVAGDGETADITAPTISGFSIDGLGFAEGTTLTLILEASEDLVAGSGAATLRLTFDSGTAETREAIIVEGDAHFPYTIQSGDANNGTFDISGLSSPAALTDAAGNGLDVADAFPAPVIPNGPSGQKLCALFNPGLGADGVPSGDDTHPHPLDGGPGCDDGNGAIYAGRSLDGADFFVTHCDFGMVSSGGSCTGTRTRLPWAQTTLALNVDTPLQNFTGGESMSFFAGIRYGAEIIPGVTNGLGITTFLANDMDSDDGQSGFQTHEAAKACEDLTAHGRSDWYLPAIGELELIYANLVATDDPDHPMSTLQNLAGATNAGSTGPLRSTFALSGFSFQQRYWSSSESGISHARQQLFQDGDHSFLGKTSELAIRCAAR